MKPHKECLTHFLPLAEFMQSVGLGVVGLHDYSATFQAIESLLGLRGEEIMPTPLVTANKYI